MGRKVLVHQGMDLPTNRKISPYIQVPGARPPSGAITDASPVSVGSVSKSVIAPKVNSSALTSSRTVKTAQPILGKRVFPSPGRLGLATKGICIVLLPPL